MARKPVFLLGLFALILILGLALSASARAPAAPSLPPDPAQVQAALHRAPSCSSRTRASSPPRPASRCGAAWAAAACGWPTTPCGSRW